PDFIQLERDFAVARALLARGPAAVHFAGVGGVGMAGLAHLLAARGFTVSGCDAAPSRVTDWPTRHGVAVQIGHNAAHITPDLAWLVRTPAVAAGAPEILAAQARHLPVLARGVVLPALLQTFPYSIAVAGTHGKTTTTAMIAQLLQAAGLAPAFAIGGEVDSLGGVAAMGQGRHIVVEADESDGTLALYAPDIAVVTNIEFDHMEHFGGEPELVGCFQRFIKQARRVIYGADDPRAASLCGGGISFGFAEGADFRAVNIELSARASAFDVLRRGEKLCRLHLPVPGRHNILNALAACAAVSEVFQGLEKETGSFSKDWKKEGSDFPSLGKNHAEISKPWKTLAGIFQALENFCPARRRFEVVSEAGGVLVISDYAHHPTEVRALVAAARGLNRRLAAVFQPHRYTRTLALGADFPGAFAGVDEVVLAPVYAASEAPLAGGTSHDLARHFAQSGVARLREVESLEAAWFYLRASLKPDDVLLVVGAGDVEKIAFWAKEFYGKKV
ncbi:MAG: UDP-N-acetylmuramate--L-alanine ligase, partial [Kiritimatiellaeota bacterium]|nr:UDP-N-acetylmuramate--L-alanine ligase [Kiritimatiellota bacterium]